MIRRDPTAGGNMTDRGLNDEAMKLGLLMEAARAQQSLAQESLERLAAHTRDLGATVRDEIRRTVAEEVGNLAGESRRAAESLQCLRRAANLRVLLWTVSIATVCSAVAMGEAWWMLPSQAEVSALRARRDALAANIVALQQRGALLEVRKCGERERLCVRVDRSAPAYGPGADYLVVKGY
jgi:hypothetical protein